MASELQAQKLVHELEHGKGRWWIWLLVIVLATAYQVVCFIEINPIKVAMEQDAPAQFAGLSDAKGMEPTVIARELARGNGFSTTAIKPAAIDLVIKKKARSPNAKPDEDSFQEMLRPDGPTGGRI